MASQSSLLEDIVHLLLFPPLTEPLHANLCRYPDSTVSMAKNPLLKELGSMF